MESTSDSARGGQFSGSRSTITDANREGATPEGSTTEESRGGLFPGRSNNSTLSEGAEVVIGQTTDTSSGGLFTGGNTSTGPNPTGAVGDTTRGETNAAAAGGLFTGGSAGIPVIEGPQGPEGPPGSPGSTGPRGLGITDVTDNRDGTLTITYGDGRQLITSDLRGMAGQDIQVGMVDAEFDTTSRDLTITVDGITDTVNIPTGGGGGGTPVTPVTSHRFIITFTGTTTATSSPITDIIVRTGPSSIQFTDFTSITSNFTISVNGVELLGGLDFNVSGNTVTILQGYIWATDDIVIINFTTT